MVRSPERPHILESVGLDRALQKLVSGFDFRQYIIMQFPEDEACQEPIIDDCSPQLKDYLLKGKYRLGEPNKNGRFNIDIKAMKAALEAQGVEDRTFFASRFNKII